MGGLRSLTARQRGILALLSLALVAVVATMAWYVRASLQAVPTLSLLPTPTPRPPTPTAVVTVVSPTPTPVPTFSFTDAGATARAISDARDLAFRWETPLTLVDTYDLSVSLYRHYEQRPPFPLSDQQTLEALDLWPIIEVRPDPVAQAEEIAALYFPEEGQLYLRRDWNGDLEIIELQVAYGYARALPEQYGDLQRLREETSSLDRRIALDALAQGDALLALWRYAGVAPGSEAALRLQEEIVAPTLARWRTEDPQLATLTRFSLDLGSRFVTHLYETEGLAALDEAVLRPPRATEQLLHPEQYVDWRASTAFDPVAIDLGRDWTLTQTTTVGEALMQYTLDAWARQSITATATGWDGDLLQMWRGPGREYVILWQTAWDSRERAADFAWQLRAFMPYRVGGLLREAERPEGIPLGRWWEGGLGAAYLRRSATHVALVWGSDAEAAARVAYMLP